MRFEQQPNADGLYACRYTGASLKPDEVVWVGANIPGVRGARYAMANTAEARAAKKASDDAFHAWEANCNTCKHLERIKHDKSKDGFLYGKCGNQHADIAAHQYPITNGIIQFHPDDPMHMPCYESRYK